MVVPGLLLAETLIDICTIRNSQHLGWDGEGREVPAQRPIWNESSDSAESLQKKILLKSSMLEFPRSPPVLGPRHRRKLPHQPHRDKVDAEPLLSTRSDCLVSCPLGQQMDA